MKAKCIRDAWDGKTQLYIKNREYDIDPQAPWAMHFDLPKEPAAEKEVAGAKKSKVLDTILR